MECVEPMSLHGLDEGGSLIPRPFLLRPGNETVRGRKPVGKGVAVRG